MGDLGELGVGGEEPLGTRAAGMTLLDAATAEVLAGGVAEVPEGESRAESCRSDTRPRPWRRPASSRCGLVDVGHLGHEQERRAPAGAVDAVVLQQEFVFGGRADAALRGDAHLVGRVAPASDRGRRGPGCRGRGASRSSSCRFCLNSSRIGPIRLPVGGKGVTAAVEPRFEAVLGYPQAPLGEILALDHRGAEVAHLEDDLLAEIARACRGGSRRTGRGSRRAGGSCPPRRRSKTAGCCWRSRAGPTWRRRIRGSFLSRRVTGRRSTLVMMFTSMLPGTTRRRSSSCIRAFSAGSAVADMSPVGPLERGLRQQLEIASDLGAVFEGRALQGVSICRCTRRSRRFR